MRAFKLPTIIIAIALAVAPSITAAAISSEASVVSSIPPYPDQTEGGWDVPSAEVFGFAEWTPPLADYTVGFSGLSGASAQTGRLSGNLVTTVAVDPGAPANRRGGDGGITARFRDDFWISAGISGLADGEPVQIRLQASLRGWVEIGGEPSGTSSMQVFLLTNVVGGPSIDYGTGGLNPPHDFEVDEYWNFIVDTTIGARVNIDSLMTGTLNATAFEPGAVDENFMIYAYEARVSHAPGFETIGIDSEAGAPVEPLTPPDDADSDGIPNATDNCIVTANPTQLDTNADNYGNACDPDLTNDCLINFGDLAQFRSAFFPRPYVADADFNGDGFVNFGDLAVVSQFFLESPGPTNLTNVCDPAPFTSGSFTADAAGWFDLDLGMTTADAAVPSDIHWRVVTAHDAVLEPLSSARLAVMGPAMPSYADCVAAPMSFAATGLWRVEVGHWLCATTDDGRVVRVQITASDDAALARATEMDIAFTTWPW